MELVEIIEDQFFVIMKNKFGKEFADYQEGVQEEMDGYKTKARNVLHSIESGMYMS